MPELETLEAIKTDLMAEMAETVLWQMKVKCPGRAVCQPHLQEAVEPVSAELQGEMQAAAQTV